MNITPMKGRVLVLPKEREQKSASGLFLGDNTNDKTQEGTIVALPLGHNGLIKGEIAIFPKGCGIEMIIDGSSFLMLNECDIIATY